MRTVGYAGYGPMDMRNDLILYAFSHCDEVMADKKFVDYLTAENYSLWDFVEQLSRPYAWSNLAMIRLACLKFHINIEVRKSERKKQAK